MNTYKISYGGKKEIINGVNLETALTNHGFKDIEINPQWRTKSNGSYIAYCEGNNMVFCEWVEKKEKIIA